MPPDKTLRVGSSGSGGKEAANARLRTCDVNSGGTGEPVGTRGSNNESQTQPRTCGNQTSGAALDSSSSKSGH